MIVMDDPRHLRLRNIVSRAFTPRVVANTEASVRDRAHRLVEKMIAEHPDGAGEAVAELAGPLPLQVICDMMGIPEDDHQQMFHWTNVILGFGDKDIATDYEEFVKVSMDIGAYATAVAEDRRVNPRDDLTTALVLVLRRHSGSRRGRRTPRSSATSAARRSRTSPWKGLDPRPRPGPHRDVHGRGHPAPAPVRGRPRRDEVALGVRRVGARRRRQAGPTQVGIERRGGVNGQNVSRSACRLRRVSAAARAGRRRRRAGAARPSPPRGVHPWITRPARPPRSTSRSATSQASAPPARTSSQLREVRREQGRRGRARRPSPRAPRRRLSSAWPHG